MSFARPKLQEIIARIKTDVETRLATGKLLVNSLLAVLATAYAGAVHSLYGYIDWAVKQLFPDTAEAEYLERWASIWAVARRAADFAVGDVLFTGTNTTVIPAGTVLQRVDGAEFETLEEGTITGGEAVIQVVAVNAGEDGNTPEDTELTLQSPIAGVNNEATVQADGLAGGAEAEDDESLRERLITKIQEPPHGGADFDYIAWAKEVSGVTRAFVYPLQYGIGTVGVAILEDDNEDTGPTASAAKIEETQEYIDSVRPVTADVTVWTPEAVEIDFEIDLAPDTSAVRAAIQASLEEMLIREAEPGKTILISKIREAVSIATGENDNAVISPTEDIEFTATEMGVMGTITWPA